MLDVPNSADYAQIQVYNNELINYSVINRGLKRLYDNDSAVYTYLSGYITYVQETLTVKMTAVENIASEILSIESNIDAISSVVSTLDNTSNYLGWDTAATLLDIGRLNWDVTYTIMKANSALWNTGGTGTGVQNLTELLDVNAPSPSSGDYLVWNSTSNLWESSSAAAGLTISEVNTAIDAKDVANDWTVNSVIWAANEADILGATTYVTTTSADIVETTTTNGYGRGAHFVSYERGVDSAENLLRSFYSPIATASYGVNSTKIDTSTDGHDIKQLYTIYVEKSSDDPYDLSSETLTKNAAADGGTPSDLYIVLTYAASKGDIFNVPNGRTTQLARINACTFGFTNIDISNSYTMFNGFDITACTFAGTVGQKFYFSNCKIDISTLTITNACEFIFDNSCTIVAGVSDKANLTITNAGIPTYSSDPSVNTYASLNNGYIYNNSLVGFTP